MYMQNHFMFSFSKLGVDEIYAKKQRYDQVVLILSGLIRGTIEHGTKFYFSYQP